MSKYINIYQLTIGCVSGRISEWPMLAVEARKALDELAALRAERDRLRAKIEDIVAELTTPRGGFPDWNTTPGRVQCALNVARAALAKEGA